MVLINYLRRWTSSKPEEQTVSISHALRQNELRGYEPFYVSPGNIPSFDERFLGYGFTRVSQVNINILLLSPSN